MSSILTAANGLEVATLVELCGRRAAERPDRRAFVFLDGSGEEAESLTFRELDDRARAIAVRLRALAPPGARAVLSYPPGLEFVAAFFGCLYAGLVAVPAPPVRRVSADARYTRFRDIVGNSAPELLLSDRGTLAEVDELLSRTPSPRPLTAVATDEIDGLAPGGPTAEGLRPPGTTPNSVAYLQYTSGTTGTPRGVVLTHGNVLHNLSLIVSTGSRAEEDYDDLPPTVTWLPTFHDMGLISGVLQPVYLGYESVLMAARSFAARPANWLGAISRYGATIAAAPSLGYELCLRRVSAEQRRDLDLSRWRVAAISDEPLRAETIEAFSELFAPCGFRPEAFFPSYGMAESTVLVSGGPLESAPVIREFDAESLRQGRVRPPEEGRPARRLVACGTPDPSLAVAIADPRTGSTLPADEVGEVLIAGPSLGSGYWDLPDETDRTFGVELHGHGDRRFLRTGNLGFLAEGQLFVTCRVGDLIVLEGRQHYPYDIERTAERAHVAVREGHCCAVLVPDGPHAGLVVLAEIGHGHRAAPAAEVRDAVRDAVRAEHDVHVDHVVLLDVGTVLFTTSGKLRRADCREALRAGAIGGAS